MILQQESLLTSITELNVELKLYSLNAKLSNISMMPNSQNGTVFGQKTEFNYTSSEDACLHDTLCVVVVLVIMHEVLMGRNRMKFLAMYISVRANLKN